MLHPRDQNKDCLSWFDIYPTAVAVIYVIILYVYVIFDMYHVP